MNRFNLGAVPVVMAAVLTLAACGGSEPAGEAGDDATANEPVTLTYSGWTLDVTPEFTALADTFHALHPDITVEVKEYDSAEYETQMTADLSAGAGTDLITLKSTKIVNTWSDALLDVTDLVAELPDDLYGTETYAVDGTSYAVPYRQDITLLFYNTTLFEQAGVAVPDGSWTWDDYATAAEELTTGLEAAGSSAVGTYMHGWQSMVQGPANAQVPDAQDDYQNGDFGYLKPFYERALALQDGGAQPSFADIQTNKLTYQAEFGKQNAAMMIQGTFYIPQLTGQQASGEADPFEWGIAPLPQLDRSTLDKPQVQMGATGIGINKSIDDDKLAAAQEFLKFLATEDAALALADAGALSSLVTPTASDAYFGQDGMPTDDLSKETLLNFEGVADPAGENVTAIQAALKDMHSAIMTGSVSIDDGIAQAEARVKGELGL